MTYQTINNIPVWGEPDQGAVQQIETCLQDEQAVTGALMGDHHLGYSMPIGGVVAYNGAISPSGVGFDIACVDGDTEYLTPGGWKRISEYSDGDRVMQYDPYTDTGSWTYPLEYVNVPCEQFLKFNTNKGIDQLLSPNHRMLIWEYFNNHRRKNYTVITAQEFAEKHNRLELGYWADFQTAFYISTEDQLDLSEEQIRVQVMVSADATFDRQGKAVVSVKKLRKQLRAERLLVDAGIEYTTWDTERGYKGFRFDAPIKSKTLTEFWRASKRQLEVVSDECLRWDGNADSCCYYTTLKDNADLIQFAFAATGLRSYLKTDAVREDRESQDFRVFGYHKTMVGMRASPKSEIDYVPSEDGRAYCFRTPTGFWVMRRNGKVVMTGNCGNKAVLLDADADEVRKDISKVMDRIFDEISFGVGRKNKEEVDHELFDSETWGLINTLKISAGKAPDLKTLSRQQLGTVGSGNHYVDIFVDELDRVWCGVHFGSRGLGHKIASHFIKAGGGNDGMHAPAVIFTEHSELGHQYIRCMKLAGEYAYAGRDWVCGKVASILGAHITDEVHNHHNFAWKEEHKINGELMSLWVVRKGATPAYPGQRGFVGGSMGDKSVILCGADSDRSKEALYSTVHGAGRVMSRTQAAGKKRWDKQLGGFVQKSAGEISPEMMMEWVNEAGVELRGAGTDEAPHCYKRLPDVLESHKGTINILHTLTPIGVAMAGAHEFDPYKD